MNQKEKLMLNAKANIFKALGHPTRLRITEQLQAGEKCVCEFVDEFGTDFSTVSKHLSVLKEAGIVESEKRGKQVFYCLKVRCIMDFMSCVEAAIESRAKAMMAIIE